MQKLSVAVTIVAGLATAFGPIAASAQDALRDAVTETQQKSDAARTTDADVPEPTLLTEAELDELVAPVALYPDALLAQVLVAATYPLQIVEAERFLGDSAQMSDEEAATALESKSWDPSVLVLASGFPTVVKRMSEDLEWTDRLGRAMLDQDDDVLAAVQRKRAEAKEMGYLADNAAQTVETDESGDIAIEPADPKVVYVPTYDPQTVYTTPSTAQPYVAPVSEATTTGGFHPNPLVTGALAFGAALLVSQLFGNGDDDDNDDGWDDYWHRRQFDWKDRQFYPRAHRQWDDDRRDQSWDWERDRYWDPRARRWDRNGLLSARAYQDDRRDTLGWIVVPDPDRHQPWVRGFNPDRRAANERALREAERQAAERRQARLAAERREDARARQAEDAREARVAAERREARQKAAAAERHDAANTARERDARQKALTERRARAEADQRAKAQADRRAKAQADAKAKAQAERRQAEPDAKAKAEADARSKAQAERRAKAETDAKAKAQAERRAAAQADAKAKAQAEHRAKAQADAKAKAQADAKAKAQAERRAKAQADAKAKAQAERRAKAQADAKAKAQADARAKAQAERRAKSQADASAKAEAQAQAQAEAQAKARAQARQEARSQRQQERQKQAKCRPNDAECRRSQ
jgi:hypothetical protein